MSVTMNNSSISSPIDQLSLFMLSIQFPSYILNISISFLNLIAGVLFLVTKRKTGVYGSALVNCMSNELLASFWSLCSFIYHLYNSMFRIPETTTPFKCYQWSGGMIYFGTNASILFMFIVSVERGLSAVSPQFYQYTYHFYQKKLCLAAWAVMITIFVFTFFDFYPVEKIPICLARAAVGYYSFYFYSYFYLILSVLCSLIYIFVIIYLKRKARRVSPDHIDGSNLSEIKQKVYDRVSMALMAAVLWHTVTNSLASLATVLIVNLPYRGALIGPYLGSFYYTGAASFLVCHLIFVEDFRKAFVNLFRI